MKFLKTFLASILGTIVGLIVLSMIGFGILISSSQEPEPYIRDNTVLKIDISGEIPYRRLENPLDQFMRQPVADRVSVESLKENLQKASAHEQIEGVWLNINYVQASWSTLQELQRIFEQYKKDTDKFLYASTDDMGLNEKGYYLATAADSIFAPPSTLFEFDGFYTETAFYKNLLDKIGVDVQVFKRGKYKSAVEPVTQTEHSEESKHQLKQILEQVNTVFLDQVAAFTGLNDAELNALLDERPNLDISFAEENDLITEFKYSSEVEDFLKRKIGLEEDEELNTVSNKRYLKVSKSTAGVTTPTTSNRIAVIHANGAIIPQSPNSSPFDQRQYITATNFRKQLESIKDNENVKALVVRINSPGGSGNTSDVIWHMLRKTSENMPVIASMGPVAASGGYYIAMAADSIVALPTTITGSIGVFGSKFNARTLFNDKLGITFDKVKTHSHADWLSANRPLTDTEEKAFQQYVDNFYNRFINKAAKSRDMEMEQVDERAQGRVWVGADAKRENLVDLLGGLDEALETAAAKAGIDQYKVVEYPKPKNLFEMLVSKTESRIRSWMPDFLEKNTHTNPLQRAFIQQKGQALTLLPYKIHIQ